MEKILISACLIGDNTKFDGGNNLKKELLDLLEFYELVPFCPEVEGGLKTPRRPSEIRGDRVRNDKGEDVSKNFNLGADKAVSLCQYLGIKIAILKERSPSCGTHQVHNGLFNGILVKGMGITAKRLEMAGVRCMNEDEALDFLKELREKAEVAKEAKEAAKLRREAKEQEAEEPKKFEQPRKPRMYHEGFRKPPYESKGGKPNSHKPRFDKSKKEFEKGQDKKKSNGRPRFSSDPRRKGERRPFKKTDKK